MFEEFLKEKHAESFPQLLDDDMPDHFDSWLGSLDGDEYIELANEAMEKLKVELTNKN